MRDERREFDIEYSQAEDCREAIRGVQAAGDDCAALGKVYEQLVGYDLHADDPSLDAAGLRDTIFDHVREICYEYGIHVADVGLTEEI